MGNKQIWKFYNANFFNILLGKKNVVKWKYGCMSRCMMHVKIYDECLNVKMYNECLNVLCMFRYMIHA